MANKKLIFLGDEVNSIQNNVNQYYNNPEYEKYALELIKRYFDYYGSNASEEYVTRGSILQCSCGETFSRLDLLEDHGIYTEGGDALLSSGDCIVGKNI